MRLRHHYSLLVVRGDGRRVLRVNVPRGAALAIVAALGATLVGLTALAGDYLQLRTLTREASAHAAELVRARRVIAAFNERVGELQREAGAWRDMHARIWEAIGPDGGARSRQAGIGGAATSVGQSARPSALGDLDRLTASIREEGESLNALDRVMARAGKVLAALPMRWPVRGDVNSEFGTRVSPWTGARELHTGLDIGAGRGTPVHAPANGMIEFAGAHPEYGLAMVIDHGQDVRTVYGHLSQVSGRRGQRIERGALIGLTGNTGRSSGPHLHYEVLVKGRAVNPRAYLWD